jgi:hypothetical protein
MAAIGVFPLITPLATSFTFYSQITRSQGRASLRHGKVVRTPVVTMAAIEVSTDENPS